MAKTFTVTIPSLRSLLQRIDDFPVRTAKILDQAIKDSANLATSRIQKELGRGGSGGVDTGKLRASIIPRFSPLRAVVQPGVNYAIYLHEGTKPHYPPITAIAPWAKRHGINPYALQKSIGKKGTKANPFFERGVDASRNDIIKIFENAVKKAAKL